MNLDPKLVDAYLHRLGVSRPAHPDPEALAEMQRRHLTTVPFENLAIHLGEEIVLDTAALVRKVALTPRGGICYELNGAFAGLLTALGYRVALLAGRVYDKHARLGPPYDHLALRVEVPDTPGRWLVDVGFGQFSSRPLCYDSRDLQWDAVGVFRLADTDEGDLDLFGDALPRYRLEQRPRLLRDFEATCWWHRTSPRSMFTRGPLCTRQTDDGGRITLSGRRLTVTAPDGRRREEHLADEGELLAAYRRHFGIPLDREPPPAALPGAESGRERSTGPPGRPAPEGGARRGTSPEAPAGARRPGQSPSSQPS